MDKTGRIKPGSAAVAAFYAVAAMSVCSGLPASAQGLSKSGLESIVGNYSCVTSSGGREVGRFQSSNAQWGPWLRVDTTGVVQNGEVPDHGHVFVGFDARSKRWNIVGVDSTGAYWTRHSTSQNFDGSRWSNLDPADGGRAIVRVLHGGAQYTFDLDSPSANGTRSTSRTVCTRR